jgi:hypothetical protein
MDNEVVAASASIPMLWDGETRVTTSQTVAVKIKPLYPTNNTRYLTSNTTRISTKYFYIAKLGQMQVLISHYGESSYKTCLYGDFLNLYGDGQATVFSQPGSLYHTSIKV